MTAGPFSSSCLSSPPSSSSSCLHDGYEAPTGNVLRNARAHIGFLLDIATLTLPRKRPAKPHAKGEHEDETGELGQQCLAEHPGHVDVVPADMDPAASNPGQKHRCGV